MLNETISPGLRLEMRKTSRFYQAVLKDAEGRWRRYSTKTADREQAIRFAQRKQAEWSVLEEHGVSASAKRFDFVAREYLKELDTAKEAGTATASHSTYVRVTRKWLIPFFGSHPLPRIDDGLIAQFEDWRRNQMGQEPAKSTINKHNIVLRSVLEYAVKRNWMKRGDIPKLTVKNKGVPAERRGFFEYDEWNALAEFLARWPKTGRKAVTKYKRSVLARYVYLITMSGLRPGTEADNLRWSDFQYVAGTNGKAAYYRIYIRAGKKAGRGRRRAVDVAHRFVVVDEELVQHLETLQQERTTPVKRDDLVFCMPDGSPISGFSEMFRKALDEMGLRVGFGGEHRTLYSLRHTYATWNLRRGVTYEQLKTQMGTSIVMLQKHYDHATADTWAADLLLGQTKRPG